MRRCLRPVAAAALGLLLLGVTALGLATVAADTPAARRSPRVFVYRDFPEPLFSMAGLHQHEAFNLTKRLLDSPYYEPDPGKADYYWIPSTGRPVNRSTPALLIEHVRRTYPWWNMTKARGEARHIMLTSFDAGPRENFGWNRDNTLDPDYAPNSPTRPIIYMTFNGCSDTFVEGSYRYTCMVCFQRGKDIMLPTCQAVCGPLCGYSREQLREKTMWLLPPQQMEQEFKRTRSHLLYFAGNMHVEAASSQSSVDWDYTGRGSLYILYHNRSRFHLHPRTRPNHTRVLNHEAMSDAEFCYSPLGGAGGDTDRYVAAMLFGCVPVLLNTSHSRHFRVPHALPFEEVIPWHTFATLADNYNLDTLERQLHCLLPHVPDLRRGMQRWLPNLLWSSIYQPYINESGSDDAFETLMRVLASRVPHGYKPSRETVQRFGHPGTLFPCRADSPQSASQAAVPGATARGGRKLLDRHS